MNNFKVFAFVAFFTLLASPVLAETNCTDTAQQAVADSCQTITPAPEPTAPPQPQSQSQTTTTEQIIEKAHQYYDSALNHALTVIGIAVAILAVGFALVQILFEWERSRSFKEQLDRKEGQLQKYFDGRLIEEIKKLKEDAEKQVDEIHCGVNTNLRLIYYNLSIIYEQFCKSEENNQNLDFCGVLWLLTGSTDIDMSQYERAICCFDKVKGILSKITEKSALGAIHVSIKCILKKIGEIEDNNLKEAFDEMYEAFVLKKHELGYTGQLKDKQEVADLNKYYTRTSESTPDEQFRKDRQDISTQAIAKFAKGQDVDILKTDDAVIIHNAIAVNLGKEPQDLTDKDYDSVNGLSLHGKKITDITLLKHCKNMVRLHLSEARISDISALNGLTKLTALWLDSTLISDISALNGLTNLSHLYLSSTQISDISSLGGLTKLIVLDLNKTKVNDLTPIRGLDNLAYLGVSTTQLDNIQAVSELTNLRFLGITNTKVRDLTPIKQLKHLENLFFSGTLVNTLESLKGLNTLRQLSFRSTKIDTLEPLKELTDLQTLKIQNTQISNLELIKGLTNLTELWLGNNQISDLRPLAGLTNLMRLELSDNQISDISTLSALNYLLELYLSNNPINDIGPLKELKKLEVLYIEDCKKITDQQVEDLKKALPKLKIIR